PRASPRAHVQLVAVGVDERDRGAPALTLRWRLELDALRAQLLVRGVDIVAPQREAHERPDQMFLAGWSEQGHARLAARNAQVDPALTVAERLIGRDREAELLRVERECLGLVPDGNG